MHSIENGRTILPVDPSRGAKQPIGLHEFHIDETGYWGQWQKINADSILDHCLTWMNRVGWVQNFEAAARGTLPQERRGREFTDSDVYKLLEALVWESARTNDERREEQIASLVAKISAAQEADGYLNTNFGRSGQAPRYSDLEWGHELYNYGHLLQAATARLRTNGEDALVEVGTRVADHICNTFGPDGIQSVCGHPEIEMALVEFGRATGNQRYIEQARLFLDRRGHGSLRESEYGREYFQDDIPIREATVLRGHAVRALYLSCAAVDSAVETGDSALLTAIERQWEQTLSRRTYITGGMGSHHQDEAFGNDFELPSDRAYCESCAGVGSFMLSWRLLLATGNERYADSMERTLHNVIATAPGRDGKSFFYSNTLHQRNPGEAQGAEHQSLRASSSQRAAWFEVSCCPPNIARTLASLSSYVATVANATVTLQLYVSGDLNVEVLTGKVSLRIETDYPYNRTIRVTILDAPEAGWVLALRIPRWSANYEVRIDGVIDHPVLARDCVSVQGLEIGQVLELDLDDVPRFSYPDDRIDAIRGTVAVERGPLVYCLESAALPPGVSLDDVSIDTSVAPSAAGLGVVVSANSRTPVERSWAYGKKLSAHSGKDFEVSLTPYSEWGESGPVTMRVWTPVAL